MPRRFDQNLDQRRASRRSEGQHDRQRGHRPASARCRCPRRTTRRPLAEYPHQGAVVMGGGRGSTIPPATRHVTEGVPYKDRSMRRLPIVIAIRILPGLALLAQTKAPKAVKRAQPPKLGKSETFYADAFKEGLVGQRPADLDKATGNASPAANSGVASTAPSSSPPAGSSA